MRYLLHRSTRTGLSKAVKKRNAVETGKDAAVNSASARQEIDTSHSRKTCGGHHVVQWGQQCSPSCGCVVRFQATIDPVTKKYESIEYVARRVVTHEPSGRGATLLTARGRPMLKECQCGTLHHLASEATSQFQGKTTSQAKNMLEFHSTRSSTAFRKTALVTQGLPSSDAGCFDVMEEALTAMVKGYMPPYRQQETASSQKDIPHVTYLKGRGYHKWKREDDDSNSLDFSKFWNDYDVQKLPGPMSTLAMLDLSMSLIAGKDEDGEVESTAGLPQDWQSYVDQLYEDEQQSA